MHQILKLVLVMLVLFSAHATEGLAKEKPIPWHMVYWGIDHLAQPLLADVSLAIPDDCPAESLPECSTVTVTVSRTGQATTVNMTFLEGCDLPEPLNSQLKLILMGAQYQPGTDAAGSPIDCIVPVSAIREGKVYKLETDVAEIKCVYPEFQYYEKAFVSPNRKHTIRFFGYESAGQFFIHTDATSQTMYQGIFRSCRVQWTSKNVVKLMFATSPFTYIRQYYLPTPAIMSQCYDCLLDCLPDSQVLAYLDSCENGQACIFFADVQTGNILFTSPIPPILICAYNCGCCDVSGEFRPDGCFVLLYDCSTFSDDPYVTEKLNPLIGSVEIPLPPEILNSRSHRTEE